MDSGVAAATQSAAGRQQFGEAARAQRPRAQVEAGENIDQMAPHQIAGTLAGAGTDGSDQLVMSVAFADGVAPPPVERHHQRGARGQFAHEGLEDRLAGNFGDGIMEGGGERNGAALFVGGKGRVFLGKVAVETRHVGRPRAPGSEGAGAAVKLAEALVGLKLFTSKTGGWATPAAKPYAGALAAFDRVGVRA